MTGHAPLRHLAAAAVAAALAAGLAGCGLPTHSGVHIDGPLRSADSFERGEPRYPPGPDAARSVDQLVDYFLLAAAGDPANAADELRRFVVPERADDWEPDSQVLVVREIDRVITPVPPDRFQVRLDVQPIGVLTHGMVESRAGGEPRRFVFEVVQEALAPPPGDPGVDTGVRLRVADPPQTILLVDRAFADRAGYLLASPVYFWDVEGRVLVPDLRWVPSSFAPARRAQAKLEWLTAGPAPWLESLVGLPAGVELEGNVVVRDDGRGLDVTLTAAASQVDPLQLNAQVWWTLRDVVPEGTTVLLHFDGQRIAVVPDPRAARARPSTPPSYVALGNTVVPYEPGEMSPPPVPEGGFPGEVRAAALSGQGGGAVLAVVHEEPATGAMRLSVATRNGVQQTDLVAQVMSRPVWLRNPQGVGLVVADGQLYRFDTGRSTAQVAVPNLAGPLSAVAVAPEGRRIALVAAGRLYVASLAYRADGWVGVSPPRGVSTTAADLDAVAFTQDNRLAVIGSSDGRRAIYELTVDGAMEVRLPDAELGAPESVGHLVAYPTDPYSLSRRVEIMYEMNGFAYRYRYLLGSNQIALEDLAEAPSDAGDASPRAPFFAE